MTLKKYEIQLNVSKVMYRFEHDAPFDAIKAQADIIYEHWKGFDITSNVK